MADKKPRPPLRRPRHPMPPFVLAALRKNRLHEAYLLRPPYQRNDYLGWITRGKREETKQKRLNQMLAELKHGNLYMKMDWNPKPQTKRFFMR